MNKELLEVIDNMIERLAIIELHTGKSEGILIDKKTLLDIQKELELQEIKNANSSEALKELEELLLSTYSYIIILDRLNSAYPIIKKALLQAQKKNDKEIAFDLIDTKNVDIKLLKWAYPSVEAYNVYVREHKDSFPREELTKEEFEFLGRMVGAK